MGVLILLLVLLNVYFGVSQTPQTPVDTPASAIDASKRAAEQSIDTLKQRYGIDKDTVCKKVRGDIYSLAGKMNWVKSDGIIQLPGPNNKKEFYKVFDCQVAVNEIRGTLSGAKELTGPVKIVGQGPAEQEFKPETNTVLFRTLLQILMYVAGLFWLFRLGKNLIAGDLTGTFVSFIQGIIIISTMYVLYRLM
jgi:hypothetical protein